jgi:thiol-disulfide isomerase/thioredoxin
MNRFPLNAIPLILSALMVAGGTPRCLAEAGTEGEVATDFALPQRNSGTLVRLADCRGQIVVLDFFAYWCVPCARASAEVETGLRQYYEERKGNAHGRPVRVLAVNVETARADKTDAFIQKAGLTGVLEDARGGGFSSLPWNRPPVPRGH